MGDAERAEMAECDSWVANFMCLTAGSSGYPYNPSAYEHSCIVNERIKK